MTKTLKQLRELSALFPKHTTEGLSVIRPHRGANLSKSTYYRHVVVHKCHCMFGKSGLLRPLTIDTRVPTIIAPRSLLPEVHRLYFKPEYPEFSARTMWSLSNAFTTAFKKLDPVPQFKATV